MPLGSYKEHKVSDFPRNKDGSVNRRFKDLTGKRVGRLIVESFWGIEGRGSYWNCFCECGNTAIVRTSNLSGGRTKSCGCLCKENVATAKTKHGLSYHPLYPVWNTMNHRCRYSENDRYYKKDIKVCWDWNSDNSQGCKNFINWVEENMPIPSYDKNENGMPIWTIDRYPDRNGNYEPSNVRWGTYKEQASNKDVHHGHAIKGEEARLYTKWLNERRKGRLVHEWHEDYKTMLNDIGRDIPSGYYLNRFDITKPFGPNNFYFGHQFQRVRKN